MPGYCFVCHRAGPSGQPCNFLCEDCAHPLEVRTFCAQCGRRRSLAPLQALDVLSEIMPEVKRHETGTAIRLEQCSECTPGGPFCIAHAYRIRSTESQVSLARPADA